MGAKGHREASFCFFPQSKIDNRQSLIDQLKIYLILLRIRAYYAYANCIA